MDLLKKTVTLVFYGYPARSEGSLWGVFSSEKKAEEALKLWDADEMEFYSATFTMDYRLKVKPVKYAGR